MRITFKLFAQLQDYLPVESYKNNVLTLELEAEATIRDIVERFSIPHKLCHLVLVNGEFVPPADRVARQLRDGETLAIWPPVAGG